MEATGTPRQSVGFPGAIHPQAMGCLSWDLQRNMTTYWECTVVYPVNIFRTGLPNILLKHSACKPLKDYFQNSNAQSTSPGLVCPPYPMNHDHIEHNSNRSQLNDQSIMSGAPRLDQGGCFKNVYELVILRAPKFSILKKYVSLSMYVKDILCGISKAPFEIPHKIYYPHVERCVVYW